jgi:hypothetical protein
MRPDHVGLGGFDSHALPPSRGVLPKVIRLRLLPVFLLLPPLPSGSIAAQQPDTASRIDTVAVIPERKPPLSPRRAFLYSLAVPGYSQSILGRHRAGALQIAFEAAAIVMVRMSAADLQEARRNLADSVVVSFVDAQGNPGITRVRSQWTSELVRARRAHVEDWIAVWAANHLFSALDAFVAAHLWDLPAEVAVTATPRSTTLALKLHW